jgi:hypothetical protein
MRQIQSGALLPADLDAAKFAGFDAGAFVPPETALIKARDRAAKEFHDATGLTAAFAHPATA